MAEFVNKSRDVTIKPVKFFFCIATLLLASCGYPVPPCLPPGTDIVSVVSSDWHSEIAIPVGELGAGLQPIAAQFPGATTLLFGYGKQSFMTAPEGSFSKYFTGLVPGQAAIAVEGVRGDLANLYQPGEMVTLTLPDSGAAKLSAFIRADITDGPDGTPQLVTKGDNPRVLVYAANSGYNFLHTCNGWAAAALAHAGISLSTSRVVTSERLMDRAQDSKNRCMVKTK